MTCAMTEDTAERAESEGDPGLRPQRRMAAGEDQPQPVVGELGLGLVVDLLRAGREPLQALQDLLLDLQRALAPQAVDRLVARDEGDPGPGVLGRAVGRPALERDHEGLLHRLLGEVEVTEDADQTRDRPPRLVPEQAVDDLIGGLYEPAVAPASVGSS